MNKTLSGWTRDRILWAVLALLATTVAAGILFSPPERPPLAEASGDTLSFDEQQTMKGRVAQVLSTEELGGYIFGYPIFPVRGEGRENNQVTFKMEVSVSRWC